MKYKCDNITVPSFFGRDIIVFSMNSTNNLVYYFSFMQDSFIIQNKDYPKKKNIKKQKTKKQNKLSLEELCDIHVMYYVHCFVNIVYYVSNVR